MSEKTLATFKIDQSQWDEFKEKANKAGSNASAVLKDFIDAYLDGRIDPKQDGGVDTLMSLDSKIEGCIDRVLGSRFDEVNDRLVKLNASLTN
jgi:uncharacterized protein (DUF2342 family)